MPVRKKVETSKTEKRKQSVKEPRRESAKRIPAKSMMVGAGRPVARPKQRVAKQSVQKSEMVSVEMRLRPEQPKQRREPDEPDQATEKLRRQPGSQMVKRKRPARESIREKKTSRFIVAHSLAAPATTHRELTQRSALDSVAARDRKTLGHGEVWSEVWELGGDKSSRRRHYGKEQGTQLGVEQGRWLGAGEQRLERPPLTYPVLRLMAQLVAVMDDPDLASDDSATDRADRRRKALRLLAFLDTHFFSAAKPTLELSSAVEEKLRSAMEQALPNEDSSRQQLDKALAKRRPLSLAEMADLFLALGPELWDSNSAVRRLLVRLSERSPSVLPAGELETVVELALAQRPPFSNLNNVLIYGPVLAEEAGEVRDGLVCLGKRPCPKPPLSAPVPLLGTLVSLSAVYRELAGLAEPPGRLGRDWERVLPVLAALGPAFLQSQPPKSEPADRRAVEEVRRGARLLSASPRQREAEAGGQLDRLLAGPQPPPLLQLAAVIGTLAGRLWLSPHLSAQLFQRLQDKGLVKQKSSRGEDWLHPFQLAEEMGKEGRSKEERLRLVMELGRSGGTGKQLGELADGPADLEREDVVALLRSLAAGGHLSEAQDLLPLLSFPTDAHTLAKLIQDQLNPPSTFSLAPNSP